MPKKARKTLVYILAAWLIFTTSYFIYGQYNHLRNFVYMKGVNDVNAQLFQIAYECQPFLIEARGQEVTLVNEACFGNEPHSHDGEVDTHE